MREIDYDYKVYDYMYKIIVISLYYTLNYYFYIHLQCVIERNDPYLFESSFVASSSISFSFSVSIVFIT